VSAQQEICKVEIGKKISEQPIKQVFSKVEENQNASSLLSSNNSGISGSSPKVMKFARELGVSMNEVEGSGRRGRILEDDIKSM
jgi:Pyruvate/2-oxoglutarate dehydrogenase complex, dihydrolipoamide acyltransferase (E2) component, and related enzymes